MDDVITIAAEGELRQGREEQRMGELQRARMAKKSDSPAEKIKDTLNFGKKISQHWLILACAAIFDLLGLIPFIGVVFNFIFGLILFMYFGPKKKDASSELLKIGLPVALGSIFDFFLGILPVNIGATLIRIALS
jgi:hypothetical protein